MEDIIITASVTQIDSGSDIVDTTFTEDICSFTQMEILSNLVHFLHHPDGEWPPNPQKKKSDLDRECVIY